MDKPALCLDPSGVLRGECSKSGCQSWVHQGGKKIRFKPEERSDDRAEDNCQERCEACGLPAHEHRSLEAWLRSTRRWVQCLRCSDGAWPEQAPPTACLPAEAKDWAPEAAAIYVVTGGQFEPGRDGREEGGVEAGPTEGLVSVVCTTLEKDQPAHPLLYESFRSQTYEPRELVIVDSGTSPSTFLLEKAKEDPRVVYRFFFREEHGLEQAEDPFERVLKRDDPDEIIEWTEFKEEMPDMDRAEVRWEGLSLGLKRNIACHLAQGAILMHFNVNALYAGDYVSVMRQQLLAESAEQARACGKPPEGGLVPSAVALLDWHTLDFDDEEFRLMDTERRGSEVPEVKRQQVQFGKGMTYTYTRSCWALAPFPDLEEPEGRLAKVLKRENVTLKMVKRPSGHEALVAFGYMKENSCGESATANINLSLEIQILEMCSASVYLPQAFTGLLPLTRAIVDNVKSKQTGGLQALLQAEGPCFFCVHCDAAIALKRYLKMIKKLSDGAGGKVEIAQFSRAGGAVGEGVDVTYEEPPKRQAPAPAPARSSAGGGFPQKPWDRRGIASFAYGGRGQAVGAHAPFTAFPLYNAQATGKQMPPRLLNMGGNRQMAAPAAGRGGLMPPGAGSRGQVLGVAGRGGQGFGYGPNNSRAFGAPSPGASMFSQQARALGRPAQITPQPSRAVAARAPEPDPEDQAWFPGWWRRNAACRQCGNNIGWRYENEERTIFWVLETAFLREKEPDPIPPAAAAPKQQVPATPSPVVPPPSPTPIATAPVPSVPVREEVAASPKKEAEEVAPLAQPPPKVDPKEERKEEPKVEAKEEPKGPSAPKGAAEKGKAADKAEKSLETARKAIRAFSPELQLHLAESITTTDKSKFDQALNEMKLDDATRKNILQELRVRPGVAATQVEHLVAKNFKGKINQLRSLGLRVLRAALQEELPAGTLERLAEAAAKESGASGSGEGPGGPAEPQGQNAPDVAQGSASSRGGGREERGGEPQPSAAGGGSSPPEGGSSGSSSPEGGDGASAPAGGSSSSAPGGSGDGHSGSAPASSSGRPAPLPAPDGWDVEWSDTYGCYVYYDEDGQKFFQPPGASEERAGGGGGAPAGESGKAGSGEEPRGEGVANPQEAGLE